MKRKTGVTIFLLSLCLAFAFLGGGCRADEVEPEGQVILQGDGIFVGQIDSQSVEITVGGQARAFALREGVNIGDLPDGSVVTFTYIEEEPRPVIISLDAAAPIETPSEEEEEAEEEVVVEGEGVYTGQIDSHSVEIEVDGVYTAFEIGEGVSLEGVKDGSRIAFTYREGEHRPILLSIEVLDEPASGGNGAQVGEGIYVGQIDSQSVEIEVYRAFVLGDGVEVDHIDDGSLVVFTYTESGNRAVLDYLEAVDQPREGDYLHGILVGQIDGQSVEIHYTQAFALGEEVSLADIGDGADVVFTYQIGPYRPLLTSITKK